MLGSAALEAGKRIEYEQFVFLKKTNTNKNNNNKPTQTKALSSLKITMLGIHSDNMWNPHDMG